MPSLAATFKSEIRRLAAREVKKALRPLRRMQKQIKALRLVSRTQRRNIASVDRRVDRLKARVASRRAGAAGSPRGRGASPGSVRALRSRMGMSRKQFARVVGVSAGSIFGWESGRTLPRGASLERLRKVRRMGIREARARAGPGRRSPRRTRRRKGGRRRRSA